jgi:PKD repeat protein
LKHLKVYWSWCVLMILAVSASATTIVMPTDEQLIAKSPVIVEGTVISTTPVARGNAVWTQTSVSVAKSIKGNVSGNIVISEAGGILDNRITKIFGAPEYTPGEHVLLFLTPTPRGDYQTTDLYIGKFSEERTLDGRMLWSRHDESGDVVLLDASFNPIRAGNVQRDAAAFMTYVGDRVAGRSGAKNYGVENPVLDTINDNDGGSRARADFTLISEPQVYRWFTFDNGGATQWYSFGTQPGYTGGGVNEIQTAMNAWNGYASAKINYVYSGVGSGTPGGLSATNGVNEVLFNDPLNEIAGSWNPATGGIVGRGGFNGVTGSATWNAPFTADATHTQRAYTAYKITEGNLVIQDNVSPSQGLSSARLAEIVAHEFGHTLGLGHSADNTALMYATVTGLGASLRPDDQDAARWLYPNGSQTPPPATAPAAPTGLTASVSGSNVTLNWSDNANNETGQSVYVASGSGAFAKATDVAANATGATLTGFAAGSYRLYVAAFNSAGSSAQSNTVTVTIGAALQAAFNVSTLSGLAGQTNFAFTDQSSGAIASRLWQFGDGTTSSLQNPSHVYVAAGQYTVQLTVSGSGASSTATRSILVGTPVQPSTPITAGFGWSPSNPTTGQTVAFNDTSGGSPTSWSWNFGDGGVSSLQNPNHVYSGAGSYNVTMTAFSATSSGSVTHTVVVTQSVQTTRTLVSAAAQTNGIGGSKWRTELTLFNAGDSAAITMIFLPDNGSILTRTIALGAKQSVTYANALADVFGLSSGAGAIAIEATASGSTPDLKVSSRTFTDGAAGTYGQAVPDVKTSDLQSTTYLTALASSASYRTNVGLVNRTASTAGALLQLYDANGSLVGSNNVAIAPNSFQQGSLSTYFPAVASRTLDAASIVVTSSSAGAISAYGSVIDNRTQDPIYVQASAQRGSGSSTIIPAVGRAGGLNGTFWRSDVTLFNPGSSAMTVSLRLLVAGVDNRNASWQSVTLGARQTIVLADVASRFTGTANVSGALELSWSGNAPVVTSRTYTTNDAGGTFGQSIDPAAAFGADADVPGLRSDASFRTNAGFVNSGDQPIGINVSLLSSNGFTLGTGFVALAPKSQMQFSLGSLFPGLNVNTLGNVTLEAHTDSAATMFAYASMVDNISGDPVFFGGK